MSLLNQVEPPHRTPAQLEPVIGVERYRRLLEAAASFRRLLGRRAIWNVNSTAVGGGVAEMLQALVGYTRGVPIPVRWTVISGDAPFFAITKRLHNQIHGATSGGPLNSDEADHYARVTAANATEFVARVSPGDLVLLHDPQTAGMVDSLVDRGARVVWRCHIGVDWRNAATDGAWEILQPHVARAHRFVFSRQQYVPSWVPQDRVAIVPPSIDPFSPKNQYLDDPTVQAILATIGVLDHPAPPKPASFIRYNGLTAPVASRAEVTCESLPTLDDPLVVQVSRWDRLKDMSGVMRAFADHVAPACDGYLMLVGPAVSDVADDPEGAAVYRECLAQWHALPAPVRARIVLVTLPLDDIEENAAMVNAIQRHATLIAQKSLAEGFGLTVAEGMWKGRPIVGSAVGGILDQIANGTGILLPDPRDLEAFGAAVRRLLDDPDKTTRMGAAAHAHIREHFVGDRHLLRYAELFTTLLTEK
ncbi:MAG: glycosyltransferase [Dactylosporangium sp.]|nr:glycosyltransferase [Dactylosporangium sp.]NNJ60955.1 glycosyltransferase [Dactylosporangium sp.]